MSVSPDVGREGAAAWAHGFQELGERMRNDGVSREMAQRIAHGNVLWDLHAELLSIATPDELERWWSRSHDDVSRMPYLSRYRALLFARLRNSTGPWKASDLTDLNFLCCAAGYADVVVGERRTIGDLETARGVPTGAALARSLSEAVDIVESVATPQTR